MGEILNTLGQLLLIPLTAVSGLFAPAPTTPVVEDISARETRQIGYGQTKGSSDYREWFRISGVFGQDPNYIYEVPNTTELSFRFYFWSQITMGSGDGPSYPCGYLNPDGCLILQWRVSEDGGGTWSEWSASDVNRNRLAASLTFDPMLSEKARIQIRIIGHGLVRTEETGEWVGVRVYGRIIDWHRVWNQVDVPAPLPTVSLAANGVDALVLPSPQQWALTYDSTNAAACTMHYNTTGGAGAFEVAPNTPGSGASNATGSYTLFCKNSTGQIATKTVTIAVAPTAPPVSPSPPAPTPAPPAPVSCSVNGGASTSIIAGESAAVSCTAPSPVTCTLGGTPIPLSVRPSDTTTYTVLCSNGSTAAVTVTVLQPTLSISASPTRVRSGRSATVEWSALNASSCTVTGPGLSASGTSGSRSTGAITGRSTYVLVCQTGAGAKSAATTISIIPFFLPF